MPVTLKSVFNSDVRRFSFPSQGTFVELQQILSQVYDRPETPTFHVTYKDDEGDLITVTTDKELSECLRIHDLNRPVRLILSAIDSSTEVPVDLLKSWVKVVDEVKEQLSSSLESELDGAIQEFYEIKEKVEKVSQLVENVDTQQHIIVPTTSEEEPVDATPSENVVTITPIRELVKILSADLAKDMIDLSSKMRDMVLSSKMEDSELSAIKKSMEQAELLASQSLSACRALSDEALLSVQVNSDNILALVSGDSTNILQALEKIYQNEDHKELVNALTSATLAECSSLSAATLTQCTTDAESIANVIRSL